MNVVLIIFDTFRRDHLGCYGNEWVHTPNLDRFASEGMAFDRAYTGSFPTVPHRADIMTGRFTFTEFEWAPLPREAVVLSETLSKAGVTTFMVADTPHILQQGYNFQRGFDGFEWIRGQENDRWKTYPRDPALPCAPEKLRNPQTTVKQYLRNVHERVREEDYFAPRTMRGAMDWLEESGRQGPFFLYVDTFDPHEPWDPPRHYTDLYDPGYEGEEVIYPAYAPCDYLSPAELKHVRALYAGEVTLVDAWVGRLLRRIDELGLRESTAVIFTTDHGFCHGEHGLMGKSVIREGFSAHVPMWEEIARIPLLVRVPASPMRAPGFCREGSRDPSAMLASAPRSPLPPGEGGVRVRVPGFCREGSRDPSAMLAQGRRTEAIVQPADITATIYDLAGVEAPASVQGRSFLPIVRGKAKKLRDFAVSSGSIIHGPRARRWSTLTTLEWSFLYAGTELDSPRRTRPAVAATVDSVARYEKAELGGSGEPMLFHLTDDPGQKQNLYPRRRAVAEKMLAQYVEFLRSLGTKEEYIASRHRLP
jgi:arylsulfatase A-like enzyme